MAEKKRQIEIALSGELLGSYQRMFRNANSLLGRYVTALGGVDRAQARTRSSSKMMTAGIGGSVGSFFRYAAGAAAAYVSLNQLLELGRSSISEYQGQARANARLAQLMGNVKGTTDAQIESVKSYASQLQRVTTIGDDVSITGASQLATYQLQAKSIKKLMPAMADLMAGTYGVNVTQENAVQSANLLGKVFTGQVGALRRVGVSFTKAQEKVLKMGTEEQKTAMLVEVLSQNYGGLAVKLGRLDEGKIKRISNAWGDVKEQIGARLMPVLLKVATWIDDHMPEIEKTIKRVLDKLASGAKDAAPYVQKLIDAGKWIVDNWPAIAPIVTGIATAYGALRVAVIALTAAQWLLNIAEAANPVGAIILGVEILIAYLVALGVGIGWIVTHWETVKKVVGEVIQGLIIMVSDWINKVLTMKGPVGDVARFIKGQFDNVVGVLRTAWEIMQKIIGGVSRVVGKVLGIGSKGKSTKVGAHAEGGIVTHPAISWLAERGPEAVIPLSGNRPRALGLLQTAGAALGVGGPGVYVGTYAPVIHMPAGSSAADLKQVLRDDKRDMIRYLDEVARDKERRRF